MANEPIGPATSLGAATAATLADMVDRVRARVDPDPFEDYTTGVTLIGATTVSVGLLNEWQAGDIVEFTDNGEQAYVRGLSATQLDPVKRSHNATTAIEHPSATVILKNPQVAYREIIKSLDRAVAQLWPHAWDAAYVDHVSVSGNVWYGLPTDFIDAIQVSQFSGANPMVYGENWAGRPVVLNYHVPAAHAASLMAMRLASSTGAGNIRTVYRRKVTTATVQQGLMEDIVVSHAIASLLTDIDVQRHSEDVSFGDQSRAPGAALRTSVLLGEDVRQAKMRLRAELLRKYPPMPVRKTGAYY